MSLAIKWTSHGRIHLPWLLNFFDIYTNLLSFGKRRVSTTWNNLNYNSVEVKIPSELSFVLFPSYFNNLTAFTITNRTLNS